MTMGNPKSMFRVLLAVRELLFWWFYQVVFSLWWFRTSLDFGNQPYGAGGTVRPRFMAGVITLRILWTSLSESLPRAAFWNVLYRDYLLVTYSLSHYAPRHVRILGTGEEKQGCRRGEAFSFLLRYFSIE